MTFRVHTDRTVSMRRIDEVCVPRVSQLAPTFPLAGLLQLPDPVGGGDMAVDMAQLS